MSLNIDIDMTIEEPQEIPMTVEDNDEISFDVSETLAITDHSQLLNRDADDSHPISAITGLEEALAGVGGSIEHIQKNGVELPIEDKTVDITVPEKTSDLTNDSGYITSSTLSTYMQKGVDYVTAGQKSGTTLGNKATAEGSGNTASGTQSHAEGNNTTASSNQAHAEGIYSRAEGGHSHAEGKLTQAGSMGSHAEGEGTKALGNYSHAQGGHTTASRLYHFVFGEYNILDTQNISSDRRGQYIEIVGNGTADNARSNARTLDWSGNEWLAGTLTVGADPTANMEVATKQYVDGAIPTVPTNVSAFTNDAGYLVANDLTEATDADVIAIVV